MERVKIKTIEDKLEWAEKELELLRMVARRFLDKVAEVSDNPSFQELFTLAIARGMPYKGPEWMKEFAQLEMTVEAKYKTIE